MDPSALLDHAQLVRAASRDSRAAAVWARRRVRLSQLWEGPALLPIGVRDNRVCVLDGDGTTLCTGSAGVEEIVGYVWSDVPPGQQCQACSLLIDG